MIPDGSDCLLIRVVRALSRPSSCHSPSSLPLNGSFHRRDITRLPDKAEFLSGHGRRRCLERPFSGTMWVIRAHRKHTCCTKTVPAASLCLDGRQAYRCCLMHQPVLRAVIEKLWSISSIPKHIMSVSCFTLHGCVFEYQFWWTKSILLLLNAFKLFPNGQVWLNANMILRRRNKEVTE